MEQVLKTGKAPLPDPIGEPMTQDTRKKLRQITVVMVCCAASAWLLGTFFNEINSGLDWLENSIVDNPLVYVGAIISIGLMPLLATGWRAPKGHEDSSSARAAYNNPDYTSGTKGRY
jgi:hypothetical protein